MHWVNRFLMFVITLPEYSRGYVTHFFLYVGLKFFIGSWAVHINDILTKPIKNHNNWSNQGIIYITTATLVSVGLVTNIRKGLLNPQCMDDSRDVTYLAKFSKLSK